MRIFRKLVRWALFVVSALLILSGYGVTQYRTVGKITFGLLDKAQSFQLHNFLAIPFIALLFLHVMMAMNFFRRKK